MNFKRIWLALPALLLPYVFLFCLFTLFLSTDADFFETVMESVFHGDGIFLILVVVLYCLIAMALSIVGCIVALCKKWDALSMAKFAMIMKLVQIPAYLVIFVLSVALVLAVITIPLAIVLYYVNCASLFLSGIWVVVAAINSLREGATEAKDVVWVMILQAVFCADVVASIIFYVNLKNKKKRME